MARRFLVIAMLLAAVPARADFMAPLEQALEAACPSVIGVSVGNPSDKSTWRIDYAAGATCQAAAQAAMASFDQTATANNPVFVKTAAMLARLTDAEYLAIMQGAAAQLAAGNGQLARWLDIARTNTTGINLNDPVTVAAKTAIVSGGLLTQARADAVFAQ